MSKVYDGNEPNAITGASNYMMPRADLRADTFDVAIEQKGYRVIWEQALFCPCMSIESGQPDYECSSCHGKGYRYIRPTSIRALVTSINGRKDQHRIGLDEVGGAYLTPPSQSNVGFRDRFTFQDFTTKFSEVLTRGEIGTSERLRYNCLTVVALFSMQGELHMGVDYAISEDNLHVKFLKEDLMYEGDRYSILYNIRPVYVALNPIHDLRGTYTTHKAKGMEKFVQLPKQFQIRREDFVDDATNMLPNAFS